MKIYKKHLKKFTEPTNDEELQRFDRYIQLKITYAMKFMTMEKTNLLQENNKIPKINGVVFGFSLY